jgi:hypothetical protein
VTEASDRLRSTDATEDHAPSVSDTGSGRQVAVTTGLVVMPLVITAVALAFRHWYPTGDLAQAVMRLRSFPANPPLVGAAGRIVSDAGVQGNHPGPTFFWAAYPIYLLLGRSAWASEASVAALNVAWVGVGLWLVRRVAGPAMMLSMALAFAVLLGEYGLDAGTQLWNPWMALWPFTVLVLATWAALAGHRTLPLAVAAATWAVQAHAGYAVVAPALVAFAIVGVAAQLGWARRQGSPGLEPSGPTGLGRLEPGRFGVDLAIAAGVGLVMWAPPLVDEFTNEPGNLTILWQHFSSPDEAVLGLREAARITLRLLDPFGQWITGGQFIEGSLIAGLGLLIAWAASIVLVVPPGLVGHRPPGCRCWRCGGRERAVDLPGVRRRRVVPVPVGARADRADDRGHPVAGGARAVGPVRGRRRSSPVGLGRRPRRVGEAGVGRRRRGARTVSPG